MKVYVQAMSMKRSALIDWISSHTFQVMVSLAQLYLFPSGYRRHWRKEVWESFSRMYSFKHNSKLPSTEFILKYSWEEHRVRLHEALRYAIDKESDELTPKKDYDFDKFYRLVEDYFIWLANVLSKKDTITLDEVRNELDRLGLDEIVDEGDM